MKQPLFLQVIRSSSAGNCTALWTGGKVLFIDAGVPRRILDEFIEERGLTPVGLLVTHAHADHLTNPSVNFFREWNAPIYMGHEDTPKAFCKYMPAIRKHRECVKIFSGPFQIQDFAIVPFELEHDALGGCFGFSVSCNKQKVVFATDLVKTPSRLLPFFEHADAFVFESNHDVPMLLQSPRPDHLKKRIMERGHLSNENSALFLQEAIRKHGRAPRHILLAHISHECNTHEKALSVHERDVLPECGGVTEFDLTYRDKPSKLIELLA